LSFAEGPAAAGLLIVIQCNIAIMAVGFIHSLRVFRRDERIFVFLIQIRSNNFIYISKTNPKFKFCLNPNSYNCC